MSLDLTDDKSTLVKVMTWCRQAAIHYLSQCWPSCLSPNGVTRPKWIKAWNCAVQIEKVFGYQTTRGIFYKHILILLLSFLIFVELSVSACGHSLNHVNIVALLEPTTICGWARSQSIGEDITWEDVTYITSFLTGQNLARHRQKTNPCVYRWTYVIVIVAKGNEANSSATTMLIPMKPLCYMDRIAQHLRIA